MYGQKFVRKLVKSLRIEKNRSKGKTEARQCSKTERIFLKNDPDDKRDSETLKNAKRKLERPVSPAMPCKRSYPSITKVVAKPKSGNEKRSKTRNGCKVEAHESTQRVKSSLSNNDEDHIAGKGCTSMTHYNLVQKFIPVSQAMKIPDANAAVDKEWKKLETIPPWSLEKVRSKKEVILEAHRDKKKVHFATLMDLCHLKKTRS